VARATLWLFALVVAALIAEWAGAAGRACPEIEGMDAPPDHLVKYLKGV